MLIPPLCISALEEQCTAVTQTTEGLHRQGQWEGGGYLHKVMWLSCTHRFIVSLQNPGVKWGICYENCRQHLLKILRQRKSGASYWVGVTLSEIMWKFARITSPKLYYLWLRWNYPSVSSDLAFCIGFPIDSQESLIVNYSTPTVF